MTNLDDPSKSNGHSSPPPAITDATTTNNGGEMPAKSPLAPVVTSEEQSIARRPAAQVLEESRRQKILENIQHRRKLLSWISESRAACEATMNDLSSGRKTAFIKKMMDDLGGINSEQQQQPAGEEGATEMTHFRKISAMAGTSSILKRPKSQVSSDDPNALARDLRKGANIGKKMSAAVSALNTNVGWTTQSSSDSNSQLAGGHAPQSATVEGSVGANNTASLVETSAVSVAKHVVGKQLHPQNSGVDSEKTKKAKKRKKSHDAPNASGSKIGAGGTTSEPVAHQAMELSTEASSLIEKRDELSLKLNNLLEQRHAYVTQLGAKTLALPTKPNGQKVPQKSCIIFPPNKSTSELCGLQQPLRLPLRRKTHWDCVLEEMRLMATDFIGERKWKIAAAKTTVTAVRTRCIQGDVGKPVKKSATPVKTAGIGTAEAENATILTTPNSKEAITPPEWAVKTMSPIKTPAHVVSTPLYLDATIEDIDYSRNISRLLSAMVSDHWDDVVNNGVSTDWNSGDGFYAKRFKIMQNKIASNSADEGEDGESMEIDQDITAASMDTDESNLPMKQLSFDEISGQVQSSIDLVDSLKSQSGKQGHNSSKQTDVKLNREQLRAVNFVESLWKANSSSSCSTSISAVLGGNFGTGKTVAACSLVWRNRKASRHIVLCSPGAVIRWKEEFSKFNELKVEVASRNGWHLSSTYDVLVCDYPTFTDLGSKYDFPWTKESTQLSCMILDVRHLTFQSSDILVWWDSIIKLITIFPQCNRLLIEQPNSSGDIINSSGADSNDEIKQNAKLLAMKIAFVYHPFLFFSNTASAGKRVVMWAKRQKKSLHSSLRLNCIDDGISSLQMIWLILNELLISVCFTVDPVKKEDNDADDDSQSMAWELRTCALSPLQKIAYESYCSDAERFQSTNRTKPANDHIEEPMPQTHQIILSNLRKVCVHSSLDVEINKLVSFQWQGRSNVKRLGSTLSPKTTQEPNIEAAKELVEKSAKMRELLFVLVGACRVNLSCELGLKNKIHEDEGLPNGGSTDRAIGDEKTKILILASLVEAQILTSYFLSCIGIHHEALIPTSAKSEGRGLLSSLHSADLHQTNMMTDAWKRSQNVLSRFNRNNGQDGFIEETCDVIISSPAAVSSLNGGICPTAADVVIEIDEDWNGNDALHVTSITDKICSSKQIADTSSSSCKFIKIVCENTHEEKLAFSGRRRLSTRSPRSSTEELNGFNRVASVKRLSTHPKNRKKSDLPIDDTKGAITRDFAPYLPASLEHDFTPALFSSSNYSILPQIKSERSVCIYGLGSNNTSSKLTIRAIESATMSPLNSLTGVPIRHYVQSFGQYSYGTSFSEETKNRSSSSPLKNLMTPKKDSKIKEVSTPKIASKVNSTPDANSLLLYEVPPTVNDPVDNICVDYKTTNLEKSRGLNRFILGYCTARNARVPIVLDSNCGFEPLVYASSFLPTLLNTIRSMTHQPVAPSFSTKRKAMVTPSSFVGQKRLKFSYQAEENGSTIPYQQFSAAYDPTNEHLVEFESRNDWFELNVETNPYSAGVEQWPFANSVILLTRKQHAGSANGGLNGGHQFLPIHSSAAISTSSAQVNASLPRLLNSDSAQQSTHPTERKADIKKAKNHHNSPFDPIHDKYIPLYFKNDRPLGRSYTVGDGIRFNLASSLQGTVMLRFRLSDEVSSHHSTSTHHIEFGPFLSGSRARQNISNLIRRDRSQGGVTLPMGVKKSRMARKLTSSLSETNEPWTVREDEVLNEAVAKYGRNWQLAARAVSAFNLSQPLDIVIAPRRSPNQCQVRWEALNIDKRDVWDCATDSAASAERQHSTKVPFFPGNSVNSKHDYFISRNTPTVKISQPEPAPLHNPISISICQTQPASSGVDVKSTASRTAQLKESSNKRRAITTSILGATTVGKDTTVRLLPIHTTHRESIQTAAANWNPPRTDMWPMEILDSPATNPIKHESSRDTQSHHIPQTSARPSSYQQPHGVPFNVHHPQQMPMQGGHAGHNYAMYPHNRHRPHYPSKPPT